MQQNSKITVLFGSESFESMKKAPAKPVFDDEVCSFLYALSDALRNHDEIRAYPDVATFGFFCRKSSIMHLKEKHGSPNRIGKGFSFHIAPSNVPVNFAYSMVFALLSGNSVVVRASSKDFPQVRIICEALEKAAQGHEAAAKRVSVVRYDRDRDINDYFSGLSDIRVIWGGDNTINELRKSPLPPRSSEITFSDRYSLCVLDAEYVLSIDDMEKTARAFYNDTFLYDQNACSSPRLMYWIGQSGDIKKAKEKFWNAIHDHAVQRYKIEPIIAVDKLTTDYRAAIENEGVTLEKGADNLIHRINVSSLNIDLSSYTCPGGSFIEYGSESLDELADAVTTRFQTLAYLGGDPREYADWVIKSGLSGIDRIVPLGKTADIGLIWDGYDLISAMSRVIYYQ